MASITDPVVVKFDNEELRPVAEAMQALQSKIASLTTRYTQQVVPALLAHAAGDVEDSRAGQGIGLPTKADIQAMALLLSRIDTQLTAAGTATLLDKFAVRPVKVSVDFE